VRWFECQRYSPIAGVSKLTVLRLLSDIGRLCRDFHDITVTGLACQRVQVDERWSFVGAKQKNVDAGKNGHGDAWTWIAIDAVESAFGFEVDYSQLLVKMLEVEERKIANGGRINRADRS